jgi:hypothetical protein
VYLYTRNPSNATKDSSVSCVRLHVSNSGSHYQAFLKLPEVETCSLAQDNVFSLVVLDGLYKYTDSSLNNRMDSIKFLRSPTASIFWAELYPMTEKMACDTEVEKSGAQRVM